jgi:Fe-S-cluster containining protein
MPDPMSESPASASSVKVSFSFPLGKGVFNASTQLPEGRTTLTQLLPVLQSIEGAVIGRVEEEAQARGTPISCRAGCGACCRQMVPVSLFEAEALTEWMASLPQERQDELAQRFHRALLALRDAGVIDTLVSGDWALDAEGTTQLAVDYFNAHVACPFLENESCGIHPIRPLACREYLVVSPPELCSDPSVNDITGVQLPLKFSKVLYSFGQEISGDPRGWIPLVFLMAWRKSGQKPGEQVTGSGEEVLRRFLKRTAEVSAEDERRAKESKGN